LIVNEGAWVAWTYGGATRSARSNAAVITTDGRWLGYLPLLLRLK
jgi:hypothetical protein